jgi:hypothetical protein
VSGPEPAGRDARRVAAVILEVLAGLRSATAASEALGMALARYYLLERRAVSGMVTALGPRPRGRPRSDEDRARQLGGEVERLQAEVARLEALHRLSQRAIGVVGDVRVARGSKAQRRQPSQGRATARTKRVLARLQGGEGGKPAPSRAARAESKSASPRGGHDG